LQAIFEQKMFGTWLFRGMEIFHRTDSQDGRLKNRETDWQKKVKLPHSVLEIDLVRMLGDVNKEIIYVSGCRLGGQGVPVQSLPSRLPDQQP
jgi:hypothetical protein